MTNGEVTLAHIHEDILAMRKEVAAVKEQLINMDISLSKEDKADLAKARKEYGEGKTKSLAQLEKEL